MGFFKAWVLGFGKVIQAVIGARFLPGSVENELNRIPADFLIDPDGQLIYVYYGKDISDHAPLNEILQTLKTRKFHSQIDNNQGNTAQIRL